MALEIKRAQGTPGARCTRGLVCKLHERNAHTSIQVQRRQSGIPCAMVYGLFRALLGVPGFLATVAREIIANLIPASGDQDHTASPSASASFVG
jgi:hypothetical protein